MPNPKRLLAHIWRTLRTVGVTLFIAVVLGCAVEKWLSSPVPDSEQGASAGSVSSVIAIAGMALPVVGVLVAVPVLASRLVHKLYDAEDLDEAHTMLNRVAFGQLTAHPFIVVSAGRISLARDPLSVAVGGPTTLIVYDDSAVVTEQYGCLKQVLGPGFYRLGRFEKVWEIIDLRPQHETLDVFALTKEGIPVCCKADIWLQIDEKPGELGWPVHVEGVLYPYSEEAVFKAAVSKWVREPNHPEHHRTWVGRVMGGYAEGVLRNILAEYRLDWLVAPPQPEQKYPREEIRERFEKEMQARVSKVGAKLLSVKLNSIDVRARDDTTTEQLSEIVSQQWIDGWYAEWENRAIELRAEKEATLLQTDMVRTRAQVDVIIRIMESLQATIASKGSVEPYILAVRLVESLRWMSFNAFTRELLPVDTEQRLKRLQERLESGTGEPQEQEKGS